MYLIRSSPHSLFNSLQSDLHAHKSSEIFLSRSSPTFPFRASDAADSWWPSSWNTFCPWLVRHTFQMLFIWLAAFSRSPFTVSFFLKKVRLVRTSSLFILNLLCGWSHPVLWYYVFSSCLISFLSSLFFYWVANSIWSPGCLMGIQEFFAKKKRGGGLLIPFPFIQCLKLQSSLFQCMVSAFTQHLHIHPISSHLHIYLQYISQM